MINALTVRNVHQLLPTALNLLKLKGVRRESRNGPVLQLPGLTAFEYTHPHERVMFWPERDCNPALHLYESLWMLRGRNDVEPLIRYAKQFNNYTDNGITLHGAYGHRWRQHFKRDQLLEIADILTKNKDDRRAVLSMWDAHTDLSRNGRDVPCNMIATFQVDHLGCLNLVVYNRSNDMIWGALGANAVHFSILLEYMAVLIGCPMGTYTQVSSNMHGYLNTIQPLACLERVGENPYEVGSGLRVVPTLFPDNPSLMESEIDSVVALADGSARNLRTAWAKTAWAVLYSNSRWRNSPKEVRFRNAMDALSIAPSPDISDWCVAQREWFERRERKFREGEK
jgi:thymidylate synthase